MDAIRRELEKQLWDTLVSEGDLNTIMFFLHGRLKENGLLTALLLMLWTLVLRVLLITFYFSVLYVVITHIKKRYSQRMNAGAHYYCWYVLFFSVMLAYLTFNNGFMALSHYFLQHSPYVFLAACVLTTAWLLVVGVKLTRFFLLNHRVIKAMKHMVRYDDHEGLAERAGRSIGVKRKPDIWIAAFVDTPVSYGVLKKTILLPKNYKEKYPSDELYLLLLHEMTHIKQGDTAKLYLISLTGCFIWMTPAMHLFIRSFKRDAEILCDNRIMSLESNGRDTYGSLILKECAYKNARFGFGFSDSYLAIEGRLDALYRLEAISGKTLKLLAAIPVAVLLACALTYAFRAEWFVVNNDYNTDFEFALYDDARTQIAKLSREDVAGVCESKEGWLIVNSDMLRAIIEPYANGGSVQCVITSNNYVVRAGGNALPIGHSSSLGFDFTVDESLPTVYEPELSLYVPELTSSEPLSQRTTLEYLFLLITSML